LTTPLEDLGALPDRLRFHALLWDMEEGRALWDDADGVTVAPGVRAVSTPMPTATPPAANTRASTATQSATATIAPTATQTPDLAATQTGEAAEFAIALAATLTAQPTSTPTPTETPDIEQMLATAVAETLTAQPSPTPTATPTPPQPATAVIDSEANIRQGPGTDYDIIGIAAQGQRFPISGKNQDGSWWQIDYNNQTGWVAGQLVTAQNADVVPVAQHIPTPLPSASEPGAGATRTVADITFVYVPAGTFTMGSPGGVGGDDEHPAHDVTLNGFWIGQTEVTNAQFRRFIDAGGYNQSTLWTSAGWQWRTANSITQPAEWGARGNQPGHPVVGASSYEAMAYANWVAQQSGQPVHLPSETEWERAARGSDGRTWPWGDATPHDGLLNFNNRVGGTSAVGSYPAGASPFGALDMAGNVWELTRSHYREYPYRSDDGRENQEADGARVVRGGRWASDASGVRSARRGNTDPWNQDGGHGFRLVIDANR
jgi:formylglycine-generating enzyme required for sulfatase activity